MQKLKVLWANVQWVIGSALAFIGLALWWVSIRIFRSSDWLTFAKDRLVLKQAMEEAGNLIAATAAAPKKVKRKSKKKEK